MLGLTVHSHVTPGSSSVGLHLTVPVTVLSVLSGFSISKLLSPSGATTGAGMLEK